jgi:DNA-binding NarL/FixJ family response regulator
MPGSGLAAAWEIAARLPPAKIVMLTVSDEDDDLFTALRTGADGYLLKNMNLWCLPDALVSVCSGEAARRRCRRRWSRACWSASAGGSRAGGARLAVDLPRGG